jgi:hypothetical protein
MLLLAWGCSSTGENLLDGGPFGWPECDGGDVPFGDRCVDPGGLTPCELIEARGGCPPDHYCLEGLGCVAGMPCGEGDSTYICPPGTHCDPTTSSGCREGVECGDVYCAQGESCIEELCTCSDGDPDTETPDAACAAGQICALVLTPVCIASDSEPTCDTPCPPGEICLEVPVLACVDPSYDGDGDGVPVGDLNGDGLRDDCDDLNAAVGLGLPEICDGLDNDCDGAIDEGMPDLDGDGYTTCEANPLMPADCDDSDPAINPGAIDLCELDLDNNLINNDCDTSRDSCPFGAHCCPGVQGCVSTAHDPANCGNCGNACDVLEYCVMGECRDALDDFEIPEEPEIFDAEPGPANHPDVSWNWMRRSEWFSWRWRSGLSWVTSWYQFYWWELDYGIAWAQETPSGRGVLLFDGRRFVSSPVTPLSEVAGAVSDHLADIGRGWYGTRIVAFLDGEDTIPCLAPAGGMGYGLTWSDGGGGGTQVYFAALGQYGAALDWGQQLTFGSADHLYPRLSWGPYFYYMGSNYGLVYQREDDDDVQIFFQQVQGYWDWWFPFNVGWPVSNNEGGALSPDIAWSPHGHGIVYVGAEDSNLYFTLVSPFGGTLVAPVAITDDANVAAWRPSITWNPADGEFAIAYQATSPPADNQDIYFLRVTAYGATLTAPVRLTSDPNFQRHPELAWSGSGYGVTWYDNRSGSDEVAFLYISPEGEILEGPEMVTAHHGNGSGTNPAITHASVADAINGSTYNLFGWDSSGHLIGGGEFGLVWRDEAYRGAEPRIHFVRLTPSAE